MGDRTAFFYGTLMVPAVLHRVIYGSPSPEPWQAALTTARPALLLSHQRRKVKHADYPGVVPVGASSASSVRGTLVTGLTEGDIHRLDLFEGDEYARREVRVKVASGDSVDAAGVPSGEVEVAAGAEEVVAETYIWTAGEGRLEADEWDFDEFVREKLRFWVGAGSNHEYADVDAEVAAENSAIDGTGGRGSNGAITKALEENHRAVNGVLKSAV